MVRWGVVMGKTVNHFHNCAEFDLSSKLASGIKSVCAERNAEMKGKRRNLIKVNMIGRSLMLLCTAT